MPALRSLGHLVTLWPECFHARVADRLVEHLSSWLEQASQDLATSTQLWRDPEGIAVSAAILDVLARMGASVERLLEAVIEAVLAAESRLGRHMVSPFRQNLIKCLACCPDRAVEYLIDRLSTTSHVRLFVAILRSANGTPFRESLLAKMDVIVTKGLDLGRSQVEAAVGQPTGAAASSVLLFNTFAVLRALSIHRNEFLGPGAVAEKLQGVLMAPIFVTRLQHEEMLACTRVSEPRLLLKMLLDYARKNLEDVDILLRLLSVLQLPTLFDTTLLRQFFYFEAPRIYPIESMRALLFRVQSILHDRTYTQTLKAEAFEKLVVPMIAACVHSGRVEALLGTGEEGFLNRFVRAGLLNQASIEYEDSLKIAIIQVLLSLVGAAKSSPAVLKEMTTLKQEYLGFVWNYCYVVDNPTFNRVWSLDDITVRFAGYVVVTAMMDLFEYCPPKMLLPLYDSLLDAYSHDHRALAHQAADFLIPLLGRYLLTEADGCPPLWITKLRDVLASDSHSQVHHVWAIIIRKADVYFTHSAVLVPWLVQSLSRLSQTPVTVETRKPVADLAELIILWELRRVKEATEAGKSTVSAMLPRHQEIVLMFLTHTACQAADLQTGLALAERCLVLLDSALKEPVWVNTNISVARFDKVLGSIPAEQSQPMGNHLMALKVLILLFTRLPTEVALSKAVQLRAGLTHAIQSRLPRVVISLCDVLKLTVGMYPINGPADRAPLAELDSLYRALRTSIDDSISLFERTSNIAPVQASLTQLQAIATLEPSFIVECSAALMKVVQKIQKDQAGAPSVPGVVPVAAQMSMSEDTVKQLAIALDLLAPHTLALEVTMRKALLSCVASFLDKTTSPVLVASIVNMVTLWMPLSDAALPYKDRAVVLHRLMSAYTKRFAKDPSVTQMLSMVLASFRDPAMANSDITARLEPGFMMGLHSSDRETREAFFNLFDQDNAGAGLFGRVDWCLSERTCKWDSARGFFWLKFVLDAVLAAATPTALQPSSGASRLPAVRVKRIAPQAVAAEQAELCSAVMAADRAWFAENACTGADMVTALRALCHQNNQLAYDIWVQIFPQVWCGTLRRIIHSFSPI